MADHMKKYKDADYRFSVISKLVFTGFTPTLAKQLAKEAGVNVRTVKRWYQAYTKDNHITALNPKYKGSAGVSRLIVKTPYLYPCKSITFPTTSV